MSSSERSPVTRRRVLQRLFAAAASLGLAACGFQLRRPPTLAFSTLALTGFQPRSPFVEPLRSAIEAAGSTRVVISPAQAQVVFEAIEESRDRSVAAQTAAGQVRDLTLRSRFKFRLRTPGGRVLIRDTELLLTRALSYNESAALAKEQEEATLYRAMQADIVDQVMRQLAAVAPP
jgi:LPS-assembly lipoprotein